MNLIINRQLDKSEKQVIYELTLKKRQSKKTTMSEKQLAARQQLARELMLERRVPLEQQLQDALSRINSTATIADDIYDHHHELPSTSSNGSINSNNNNHIHHHLDCNNKLINNNDDDQQHHHQRHPNQIDHQIGSPAGSSCGCSFGRSDSSYSCSSQDSSVTDDELPALKKQANIKFNKSRLEHLNEELERRLYQYEYLVTREKALLGAYNMALFTNEGVNNFY